MASIVIVDDNPESRELLLALAAHRGHEAREASDGAEALELVRASPPDLVVSDVLMPTMDGYELVRRLREAPETASTPVIFCTAHFLTKEARALADRCGVRTVLTKPIEPEALLEAIDRSLAGASTEAEEGQAEPEPEPEPESESDSSPGTPLDRGRQHLRLLADRLSATTFELSAANDRLAALIELSLSMSTERNPDRLLEEFCRAARSLVGARYSGAAAWNDPAKRSVRSWCALGIADELRASLEAPLVPRFLTDPGAARLSASVEPATAGGRRRAGIPANHPDVRSLLFAPILSMNRVYGWVYLADKIGLEAFSENDAELVGTLAKQVGRIYENGKLYDAVERHTRELEVEVAERRASEMKLAERERQLSALFESAMDALIIADDDGRILEGNPAATELFGLSSGELIGRHLWSFVEPLSGRESWSAIVRAGRTSGEYQMTRADGGTRQLELRATANFIPGRHLSILHDVTERRRLEEQLRRTAKMEAIGRLAGGIAHDFNNLLTVITGNAGLILDGISADDPHISLLEEIRAAGERSATLTRQLLAFSRQQVLSPSVVDLNEVVRGLERLLARIIGEDIRLTTRLPAGLGRCEVDASQIEQVVMNLAVNSRDAMPRGGRLLLETANARVEPEAAELHGVEAGEYVLLTVSDTGSGMDAETLARLYDPFFTTKAPGRGTGLGLATVYGIVKQSRGHIDVYSERGKGATFHIYFPRVYKSAVIPKRPKEAETKGTETILLVEDDDAVRRLTSRILNRLGYRVFEADGCEDALRRAESIEGKLELLVTDLVMPDGGGRELAERICRLYPETKVLLISGYTDGAITEHGLLDRNTVFLQKPFSVASLSQKVREALER